MEPKPSSSSVESDKALPPAESKLGSGELAAIHDPVAVERVEEKGGAWKVTCACGKRIVTPLKPKFPVGRCPKCGRKLKLPAVDAKASKPVIDSIVQSETEEIAARLSESAPDQESFGTIVIDPEESGDGTEAISPLVKDTHVSRDAAIHTADLLRAKKAAQVRAEDGDSGGIISAWPRAGRAYRLVSGLLDLTLPVFVTGALAMLGVWGILPPQTQHPVVILTAFFTIGLLNDILLQLFGGSFGKRMVVLTLRDLNGFEPSKGRIIARALFKWLFIPGWAVGLVDHEGRCLHDLLCGTIVLKARNR